MRIDQYFKNRSLSDSKPDINIIEWVTLDDLNKLDARQLVRDLHEPKGVLEYADPVCVRKSFADSSTIVTLLEDEVIPYPESRFLQIQHPNTMEWCLIDREKGRITNCQDELFDDIPIIYAKK